MKIDLEAIQAINRECLRAYGAGKIKLAQDTDGRRRYEIENSEYRLTDEFDGGSPFCGIVRVIRKKETAAIWNSYYHGWLTDEAATSGLEPKMVFDFVREALRHAGSDTLQRGPAEYLSGQLRYVNTHESGDISCFFGQEAVYYEGKKVYICRYGGGLVNLAEDAGEAIS